MPVVSEHAGKTLLHQGGSFEPQRKNHFAMVITGLPDTDRLVLSLKAVPIPPVTIEKQSIPYFNETVHYAGAVAPWEDVQLVFRDYLDVDTISSLADWYRQVYNPQTGAIGWAKDYKKTAEIYLLPPGMASSVTPGAVSATPFRNRVWNLSGVFPVKLDHGDLDMDAKGAQMEINFTLSVDRAVPAQMGQI